MTDQSRIIHMYEHVMLDHEVSDVRCMAVSVSQVQFQTIDDNGVLQPLTGRGRKDRHSGWFPGNGSKSMAMERLCLQAIPSYPQEASTKSSLVLLELANRSGGPQTSHG